MSERIVPFAPDEYYHVYNRGNSKQQIFKDQTDYTRFMQLLHLSNGTKSFKIRELGKQNPYEIDTGTRLVAIGAYCLMPNHYHILLKPLTDMGVSQFMKKVGTGYAMYFNKKHDRSGSLFEGKFKSQHADSDEYLRYLYAYIHLNPVSIVQHDWKEKGVSNPKSAFEYISSYTYSSYQDIFPTGLSCGSRQRKESVILDTNYFPEYFANGAAYKTELFDWLSQNPV